MLNKLQSGVTYGAIIIRIINDILLLLNAGPQSAQEQVDNLFLSFVQYF